MRTVFITGASAGIGEACARQLAREGYRLLLCARREDRLTQLADSLLAEHKDLEVYTFVLDVRDADAVNTRLNELPVAWKQIDVLVNNAGLSQGLDPIQDGNLGDWERMIDTNVKGLLYVTKAVVPFLEKSTNAHIINIGSIAGKEVYPNGNVYCATKHAVDALNKAMRIDLLAKGIRVTAVNPGMVETEFSQVRFHGDADRAKAVYVGLEPLHGEDIADVISFALSRPKHVNINELLVMPTAQATASIVNR